jgi:hypothetical protein
MIRRREVVAMGVAAGRALRFPLAHALTHPGPQEIINDFHIPNS